MDNKTATKLLVKRRPRLSYAQWLDHFSCWQKSDQTQEAYCGAHQLSLPSFKKHRSRSQQETKSEREREIKKAAKTATHFVPLQLTPSVSPAASDIEFIFRSGVVMKIPATSSLRSVLKSLEDYL
jgi:hypothetical protein